MVLGALYFQVPAKRKGPLWAALLCRLGPFCDEKIVFVLRLADLAATDSPAS